MPRQRAMREPVGPHEGGTTIRSIGYGENDDCGIEGADLEILYELLEQPQYRVDERRASHRSRNGLPIMLPL